MSPCHSVVISGCGAVAELYYAPILRTLERRGRVRVTGLCDPAPDSVETLARTFPNARCALTFEEALTTRPDLVIIASPPRVHATQAIAALELGAAVLCEKPAASTLAEARAMATAARSSGKLLAIGMVRRNFPACRAVRRLLREGAVGAARRFTLFEGGPFRWPVRSSAYFDRARGGAGVLADLGPHVLDLLAWWFGPIVLHRAADDAMGGVEANASLDLECGGVGGVVRLSRDWRRPNELRIEAERGVIRWRLDDLSTVEVDYADDRRVLITEGAPDQREFLGCFEAQLKAVLDRLEGGDRPVVEIAEAVPVVALIEQAYATRSLMAMPWLAQLEPVRTR